MPDIDDPFKPSDATILRPRPGAGRRGSPENVPPPLRSAAPAASHAEPISDAARDLLGTGLNSLVQDPARHIDLLELQYLCLALGFTGKYQVQARGDARLNEVKQELYRVIRAQRGTPPSDLSLRWRGMEDRRNRLIRYVPWWVVGAAVLAVLPMTFAAYYAR